MNKFVMVTTSDCLYCTKALNLLRERGIMDYVRFNIRDHSILGTFLKAQGLTTVPQIYLNGERIGGYDDLVSFFEEGTAVV